jgi:hypothetical protein
VRYCRHQIEFCLIHLFKLEVVQEKMYASKLIVQGRGKLTCERDKRTVREREEAHNAETQSGNCLEADPASHATPHTILLLMLSIVIKWSFPCSQCLVTRLILS